MDYSVGINLTLHNKVTAGLKLISLDVASLTKKFHRLNLEVHKFDKMLHGLHKNLGNLQSIDKILSSSNKKLNTFNKSLGKNSNTADNLVQHFTKLKDLQDQMAASAHSWSQSMKNVNNFSGKAYRKASSHTGHGGGFGGMVGGMMGGFGGAAAGYMADKAMNVASDFGSSVMKGAVDWNFQKTAMLNAGISKKDIRAISDKLLEVSGEVPIFSMASLAPIFRDNNFLTGSNIQETLDFTPYLARGAAIMATSGEEKPELKGHEVEFLKKSVGQITKIAELAGAIKNDGKDLERKKKIAESVIQLSAITGGVVDAKKIAQTYALLGTSRYGYEHDFLRVIGHLIQENSIGKGSGTRGVVPTLNAFSRMFVGGVMTQGMAASLQQSGLLPKTYKPLKTSTIHTLISQNLLAGSDLVIKNPQKWVHDYLVPSMNKRFKTDEYKNSGDKIVSDLSQFLPGLYPAAGKALADLIISNRQLLNQSKMMDKVPSLNEMFNNAMQNPSITEGAIAAQSETIGSILSQDIHLLPTISRTIKDMAKILNDIAKALNHKTPKQLFDKYVNTFSKEHFTQRWARHAADQVNNSSLGKTVNNFVDNMTGGIFNPKNYDKNAQAAKDGLNNANKAAKDIYKNSKSTIYQGMNNISSAANDIQKAMAHFEGFRERPYLDTGGVPTIGYGHAIKKGEHFGRVSEQEAYKMFQNDIKIAQGGFSKLIKVALNSNQMNALTDFVFNVGSNSFKNSTLLAKLNKGDYKGAAGEFKRWIYDDKHHKLPALITRRKFDEELFNRPDAIASNTPIVHAPITIHMHGTDAHPHEVAKKINEHITTAFYQARQTMTAGIGNYNTPTLSSALS